MYKRQTVDRRTGEEVTLVVRLGLLFRGEHRGQEVEHRGLLVGRDALRHDRVVRVGDPVEAVERADLRLLRHRPEHARVDVPAGRRRDDLRRAVGQVLHRLAGRRRIERDRLAELLEVVPRLRPAVDRVLRVGVAEQVGQAHQQRAARPGVGRPGVLHRARIRLGVGEQVRRVLRRARHLGRQVFDQRPGRVVGHGHARVAGQLLHRGGARQVVVHSGQPARVRGQQVHPQLLIDAGREAVHPGQHQVDVHPVRRLLGLDLADQLGRGRLGVRDPLDHSAVLRHEVVDHRLGELQVPGHVEHVEGDRLGRLVGNRAAGARGRAVVVRRAARGDRDGGGGESDELAATGRHGWIPSTQERGPSNHAR